MTREDVDAVILGPMLKVYPAPQHLRHNDQAIAEALEVYRRTLEPFDRPTLEKAWHKVTSAHALWVWPNPGLIAEACRVATPHPTGPALEETRRAVAVQQVEQYTRHYLAHSKVARLAKQEGWLIPLREYVRAAAWVQAQYMAGVNTMGYSATVLFGYPGISLKECRQEAQRFLAKAKQQADKGFLCVQVPRDMIRRWKDALDQNRQPER